MTDSCPLCGDRSKTLFVRKVLGKYEANYDFCTPCDYIFVPNVYWLEEAYSEAIADIDTDIGVRNILNSLRLSAFLYFSMNDRGSGRYVDVAGGYGLLTRLMRDLGFDFYWSDPYAKNDFSRGFEYKKDIGPCKAITAFEVLEHTLNPFNFIKDRLEECQSETIIFTTETFQDGEPPSPEAWSYYAFDTGQHISFFSERGLRKLAGRLGLLYRRQGRFHAFSHSDLAGFWSVLSSNKYFVLPLALFAAWRLGSRRNSDQTMLLKRIRSTIHIN
jgi:hypothetical protein